jgi:hypothetical protein
VLLCGNHIVVHVVHFRVHVVHFEVQLIVCSSVHYDCYSVVHDTVTPVLPLQRGVTEIGIRANGYSELGGLLL